MSHKRKHQDDGDASKVTSKQKRQFTDKDRQRASVFEQLADDKHATRIQAAKKLLDEFAPTTKPDVEKLKAVYERLIRGLCSGRKSARAGYFIALSELLQQTASSKQLFEDATGGVEELLKLINRLTKPDKNSPQENRDKHIGRISAYKAFLQSSILSNPEYASDANWEFFIAQTTKQAQSNPWLREECGSMLCDLVSSSSQTNPQQDDIAKKVIDKYNSEGLLETAEGVALWLTTQKVFPELKLPKDIWHKGDLLHSTERTRLARILCDSRGSSQPSPEKNKKVKAGGSWKPQPNFAWRVVLQQAFTKFSSVAKLKQFCIEVVDNSLFAEKASSERKSWGFSLFAWAVRTAPEDLLEALFTPNFMRTLVNQRADPDRDLFLAAEATLESIASRGEKNAGAALKLFKTLMTSDIGPQFDAATKSSTISKLVGNGPTEGKQDMIKAISNYIMDPPSQDPPSPESAAKVRVILANLLVSIAARHAKHQESMDNAPIREVAQTLASFAYLNSGSSISDESRSIFHDALVRSMNHVLPKLAEPGEWLADLVKYVQKSSTSSKAGLALKAGSDIKQSINTSHETLRSIHKVMKSAAADAREPLKILQILLALTLLEVYSGDADAVDMLSELQTCYATIKDQGAQPQAFDLLLEFLLSFLSRTSSLYRQVGELVFPTLAAGISANGLDSLLDILDTKESASGQGELFDELNADEGADDVDDDDVSMDSDVEILSPSEDEHDDEKNELDTNESADDSEGSGDDEELDKFNKLLAQTLKTSGLSASAEDVSEDEEESDMDDEQMMALDPQLTKIFQERRKAAGFGEGHSKKKEQTKAKLQMTLFKSRVLDLLQIFMKTQHAQPMVFKAVIPLLSLMRTTTSSELEKKAKTTLGTWFENCDRNKEYPDIKDEEQLWQTLRDVHDEVQRPGSKQHTMICGRSSLFVAKMLMLRNRANLAKLVEAYGKTQLEVVENGTNVQVSFFTEWCGWVMQWKNDKGKHESVVENVQDMSKPEQEESFVATGADGKAKERKSGQKNKKRGVNGVNGVSH